MVSSTLTRGQIVIELNYAIISTRRKSQCCGIRKGFCVKDSFLILKEGDGETSLRLRFDNQMVFCVTRIKSRNRVDPERTHQKSPRIY